MAGRPRQKKAPQRCLFCGDESVVARARCTGHYAQLRRDTAGMTRQQRDAYLQGITVPPTANLCCVCFQRRRVMLGRCVPCFHGLSSALRKKLEAMSKFEQEREFFVTADHETPLHWQFVDDSGEQELAEKYGRKKS